MLTEGEYKTLTLLEVTGPAPVTATHKRSVPTLTALVEQGFVEMYGSAAEKTMAITDKGREALVQHRKEGGPVTHEDHKIVEEDDVTEEVLEVVQGIVSGWYDEGRIDWEDVWDRMERTRLADDRGIDMGGDLGSPAIKKIKREIRKWRAQG
jgi:DNA-binding PadR family transcriptional regulator